MNIFIYMVSKSNKMRAIIAEKPYARSPALDPLKGHGPRRIVCLGDKFAPVIRRPCYLPPMGEQRP